MRWRGRKQSDNVEDMRGQSPGGFNPLGRGNTRMRIPMGTRVNGARGGGISGIIMLVVLFFVLKACGIDPMQILAGGDPGSVVTQQAQPKRQQVPSAPANDEMGQFMATVLAETEETWNGIFAAEGLKYREPKMVLFEDRVQSACGFASSASGPFYCPGDEKLYLDTTFFEQLDRQFKASGDFAQAYVVAHEVGHHVQNLIGVLPKFNRMRQSMSQLEANQMSIRVELQADCFAGVWAHFTGQKGLLEKGDVEEALNAAQQIGDDTLQKRTQGYVVPESFNHGTSQQRKTWFGRGFQTGKLSSCDTFTNPV